MDQMIRRQTRPDRLRPSLSSSLNPLALLVTRTRARELDPPPVILFSSSDPPVDLTIGAIGDCTFEAPVMRSEGFPLGKLPFAKLPVPAVGIPRSSSIKCRSMLEQSSVAWIIDNAIKKVGNSTKHEKGPIFDLIGPLQG